MDIKKETILITGGTGFLGKELLDRIYFDTCNIRVVARNEGNLIALKEKYPSIEIMPGDIADRCIADKAVTGIDNIYHLAAFKHVGMAEDQTYQCISSNIDGTINLLESFHGDLFVNISTDKAAKISGVYGASKYITERLLKEYSQIYGSIKYVSVRYGNVIGSTGSIVPKWIKAAKEGQSITITDGDATRFFFTVSDAVDLIFEAITESKSGEVYIKKMKACSIIELAEAIAEKYGHFDGIKYIGLQPGENKHEWLDDSYCSMDAPRFTKIELKQMI